MKTLAKKMARTILGEYSAYYIYASPVGNGMKPSLPPEASFRVEGIDESSIMRSQDALIRAQAGYAGPGAYAYACLEDDRIVGLCFYWYGERYLERNYWPLSDGEAKLVQIISLPEFRGRGIATTLIKNSCLDLMGKGFCRAYARIWHSNTPSIRAFGRAGWNRIALVVEINPLRRRRPIRMRFDYRSARRIN